MEAATSILSRGIFMSDFITIIRNIEIASCNQSVRVTNGYKNITGSEFLTQLKSEQHGEKDGSNFLRTNLHVNDNQQCMSRSNNNINSTAQIIIIDCDKHIDSDGQEVDGSPDPSLIHQILKDNNIGHIIYGSYSHYSGDKGNRYRIILAANSLYTKEQLLPTVEAIILLINQSLTEHLLAYAQENNVFAQAWYYPRRPATCLSETLYLEYLEGQPVEVFNPKKLPTIDHIPPYKKQSSSIINISPINTFNEQNPLADLLGWYGYERKQVTSDHERWLSPDSTTCIAGITVKNNKFYSHHNDQFNDGYWHDAFDLMKGREGLSVNDAIIKISRMSTTPSSESINNIGNSQHEPLYDIEPKPLPKSKPAVMQFQADMLPKSISDYIFDVADRQQSLPDYVAVAAIVGLAALLGRKAVICPKQLDDWSVVPSQWGAIIGRPSAMKSPSMKEALKPLQQFDNQAANQFKDDKQNYDEECQLMELEKNSAKDKAKEALKAGNREEAIQALKLKNHPVIPTRQRLIVNDATVEKLGELLNENPNGLILVRDELSGWLSKLTKEDYQSDRAFYLECFDGNNNYTYDRIGRGTIEIQSCTLSIIGGIQPSKIATLVHNAIKGTADDGLIQRFQLAIWPDDVGEWKWIDRAPNAQAKAEYYAVFKVIHNLKFDTEDEEPRQFRFSKEAQELFIIWMNENQATARSKDIHAALESHILKMPKTIAGLALLFEIIDGGRETVGEEATARALDWADYLLSHAHRLYSLVMNHSIDGAKLLLERKSKLPNPFTARDIQRKCWSGLHNIETVNEAINWLIDYGHIQAKALTAVDTHGRPKIIYQWVNL